MSRVAPIAIPEIPDNIDERLREILIAIKYTLELREGTIKGRGEKTPTVSELEQAGVTNADLIP